MPTVSVITPTCNRAALLKEAMDSVRAQTFTEWELLIVDDGSTDETPKMVSGYAQRDARIRVIRQDHAGLTAARNRGLREARGDYIAFLDDDDLWLPEKLAVQVAYMHAHPACGLSYSRFYLLGAKDGGRPLYPTQPGTTYRELVHGNFIQVPTVMVRRSALQEVGDFSPAYRGSQDYDLWLRLASRTPIGFIDQPLACYRKHGANMTAQLAPMYREHIAVLKTLRPEPRLGVSRALIRRQMARYHYRIARLLIEERRYREAATQFAQAIRWHPAIGHAMRWPNQRSGIRTALRWLNPYLAVPYCLVRGLHHK